LVGGRSYLFQPPRRAVGPSGINPGFPGLSRYQGWVTHVLLTRSPLSPGPKARFSLDLHVLSAPPAFVLSQDQTLREEVFADRSRQTFHFELVLKGRPTRGKREDDEVLMYLGQPKLLEVLDTRRTFTVEFSKTGAASDGVKKPPTRARGQPKLANRIGYESGRLAPVRVAGTLLRRPFGRPKEYSAPA
jgi:hypothetical protein